MGVISSADFQALPSYGLAFVATLLSALLSRIIYYQFFHPLSKFPGPWYATSFSIVGAIISVKQKEPEFFMYLMRKYGSMFISPRFRSLALSRFHSGPA